MSALIKYLGGVATDWKATQHRFAPLFRQGVPTHPIPFFGDVTRARVLTVGVNPSAGEFIERSWPRSLSVPALERRLVGYFVDASVPPHPWFAFWSQALEPLGLSYQDGAAHVDLSPRATVAMQGADPSQFAEMVESDVHWFFELLPICREVRLLLLAGCVTKKWYINDFLARMAPRFGYQLTGKAESRGKGRVGFHCLVGPGVNLDAFFCSVSPSGLTRQLLVDRVVQHQVRLRKFLVTGTEV
jgi:hypothetical protein